MGLREHVRDNQLAIISCCLMALGVVGMLTRPWRDSPRPVPVAPPRPVTAPGDRPPAPPALTLVGVKADAARGVGGLDVPRVVSDPGRGRVIAYFAAEEAGDPQERLRAGVAQAWAALRPQLSRGQVTTAHLVVVRPAGPTVANILEPPAATDPAVLVHGVVSRAGADAEWPATVTEWR